MNRFCNKQSNTFHQGLFEYLINRTIAENISNRESFFKYYEVIKYGRARSNLS